MIQEAPRHDVWRKVPIKADRRCETAKPVSSAEMLREQIVDNGSTLQC